MTTKRQKAAVQFCEEWEFPKFNGNINNFKQVSTYLSRYSLLITKPRDNNFSFNIV